MLIEEMSELLLLLGRWMLRWVGRRWEGGGVLVRRWLVVDGGVLLLWWLMLLMLLLLLLLLSRVRLWVGRLL